MCHCEKVVFFHKGINPREMLVKIKNEKENTTGINAAERRSTFIYFRNPKVYKVMTAAKDMTF